MRQKSIRIGQSQGLPAPGQGLVKAFESAAGRPVHEGKGDDSRSRHAAVPGHDQGKSYIMEEHADRMAQAEDQQQKPAAHRRRQDQGQRQGDVEDALDQARRFRHVIGGGDAAEKTRTDEIAAMRRLFQEDTSPYLTPPG